MLLGNPKIHHRVRPQAKLARSILHNETLFIYNKICFNFIAPSTSRCPTWSLSSCFRTKILCACLAFLTYAFLLNLCSKLREDYDFSPLCNFVNSTDTSTFLGPDTLLISLFSDILNFYSSLTMKNHTSQVV
jgi:hypothetical protein